MLSDDVLQELRNRANRLRAEISRREAALDSEQNELNHRRTSLEADKLTLGHLNATFDADMVERRAATAGTQHPGMTS